MFTYRVLHATVGLEHLVNGVPCDPCLGPVLFLVVVVRVGGAQGLHLGPTLPLILHVVDQLLSGNLNCLHGLSPHWQLGAQNRSF